MYSFTVVSTVLSAGRRLRGSYQTVSRITSRLAGWLTTVIFTPASFSCISHESRAAFSSPDTGSRLPGSPLAILTVSLLPSGAASAPSSTAQYFTGASSAQSGTNPSTCWRYQRVVWGRRSASMASTSARCWSMSFSSTHTPKATV